jgi:hypothetical protein
MFFRTMKTKSYVGIAQQVKNTAFKPSSYLPVTSFHTSQPPREISSPIAISIGVGCLLTARASRPNYWDSDFDAAVTSISLGLLGVGFFSYGVKKGVNEYIFINSLHEVLHNIGFNRQESEAIIIILNAEKFSTTISSHPEKLRLWLVEEFKKIEEKATSKNVLNVELFTLYEKESLKKCLKEFFPEIDKNEMNEGCYRDYILRLCTLINEKNQNYMQQQLTLKPAKF